MRLGVHLYGYEKNFLFGTVAPSITADGMIEVVGGSE
jgi:hypothetical protein